MIGNESLRSISRIWIAASVVVVIISASVAGFRYFHAGWAGERGFRPEGPRFVGSETCASCHQAEAALWRGSQHKHAMDHATNKSVLGDFANASFDYNGVHSRFFRDGEKFMVETDGPDGNLATL